MARLRVVRRPLLLLAAVAVVVGAYVGVASALNARHQRHRDQAFQAWTLKAGAVTDAKLPILIRKFSAVRLPAYVQTGGRAPQRVGNGFSALFGPWSSSRSVDASSTALAAALRAGGFADVTVVAAPAGDGSEIIASATEGTVSVSVRPISTRTSRIVGSLQPHIPHCC